VLEDQAWRYAQMAHNDKGEVILKDNQAFVSEYAALKQANERLSITHGKPGMCCSCRYDAPPNSLAETECQRHRIQRQKAEMFDWIAAEPPEMGPVRLVAILNMWWRSDQISMLDAIGLAMKKEKDEEDAGV
jgi:hypothetical protein